MLKLCHKHVHVFLWGQPSSVHPSVLLLPLALTPGRLSSKLCHWPFWMAFKSCSHGRSARWRKVHSGFDLGLDKLKTRLPRLPRISVFREASHLNKGFKFKTLLIRAKVSTRCKQEFEGSVRTIEKQLVTLCSIPIRGEHMSLP